MASVASPLETRKQRPSTNLSEHRTPCPRLKKTHDPRMCTSLRVCGSQPGCVSCELVCVCVSLERVVIICLASIHTALMSSPSLTVLHLPAYIHTYAAGRCAACDG